MVRDGDATSECRYSGNGKTPLICAAGAFLSLAIAMVVQHTHLLLAVSKSDPDPSQLMTWDSHHLNTLTWQAAFFFITTWYVYPTTTIMYIYYFPPLIQSKFLRANLSKYVCCHLL